MAEHEEFRTSPESGRDTFQVPMIRLSVDAAAVALSVTQETLESVPDGCAERAQVFAQRVRNEILGDRLFRAFEVG